MDVSAATWNTLSRLLDEALDLDPAARASWIDGVAATLPELAPVLRKLLAAHASSETSDLLQRLPSLEGPAVSASDATGLGIGSLVGPYRLKRELGGGGMADVWLAERADGAFEREIALKLPRLSRLRRDLAARFAHERDILARLEHPHIARFYDAGVTTDGLPYLAMEYVDGQPITRWCDEHRLEVAARLRLFAQVLDAVQFAHANLIIHRDLKPSNILVTEDGQVQLLDFGIAKLLADGQIARETQLTQFAGRALTPDYASPEQIRGDSLTIATDVYSLGVVLYELLAGQLPYQLKVQSVAQLEQAIIDADPARPSSVVSAESAQSRGATQKKIIRALRGDLDTVVLKALAKEPAQRYSTIAELADDLNRHLAGQTVHARPASWAYRARKFVVRNALAVGAAATLSVVLVAATVVSLWQAQRAEEQAQRAEQQATRAEEVNRFVLSVLENASPYGGAGRQASAGDLLLQANQRLAAEPVADPETLVELQTSIGKGLRALGEYQKSLDVLRNAARVGAERLGADHPQTLAAQLNAGWSAIFLSQLDLAAANLDAAERGMRSAGDAPGLVAVLVAKSELVRDQGQPKLALSVAKEAVQVGEEHAARTGDQLPLIDALIAMLNKMRHLGASGHLGPARRAWELARGIYGERPTDLALDARRVYASAQMLEGDPATGIAELRIIARQRAQLSGEFHHAVATAHHEIGYGLNSIGDVNGAITEFHEALRILLARSGGEPNMDAGNSLYNLGVLYGAARRYSQSLAEFQKSDSMYTKLGGADHPMARLARSGIAMALTELERFAEADAIFTQLQRQTFEDPYDTAMLQLRLGALRSTQGKHADAQRLLRESAAFLSQPSLEGRLAAALRCMGEDLLEDQQAMAALEVLQRARGVIEKKHLNGSPELAEISVALARAHLELGHREQALAEVQRGTAFWDAFDAENRSAGMAHLWHARTLAAAGQTADAAVALQRAAGILATTARAADRALLERTRREVADTGHPERAGA
jgi:eukaryotic-like serine/threonine-protein kinase